MNIKKMFLGTAVKITLCHQSMTQKIKLTKREHKTETFIPAGTEKFLLLPAETV